MFLMSSAAALALALASAPNALATGEASASLAANAPGQIIGTGAWRGSFLQRDWTFEFSHQDGRWSGRYIRSDAREWHALTQVTVSGRSVSFNFNSEPGISFALELDAEGRTLSGTATIDGLGTVPFSAARAP